MIYMQDVEEIEVCPINTKENIYGKKQQHIGNNKKETDRQEEALSQELMSMIVTMSQGRILEAKVALKVDKGTTSEDERQRDGGDNIRVVSKSGCQGHTKEGLRSIGRGQHKLPILVVSRYF